MDMRRVLLQSVSESNVVLLQLVNIHTHNTYNITSVFICWDACFRIWAWCYSLDCYSYPWWWQYWPSIQTLKGLYWY